MLPDELKHQKFIKIGVQQGSRNRVEFPIVVVRPLGKVHDHELLSSADGRTKSTAKLQSAQSNSIHAGWNRPSWHKFRSALRGLSSIAPCFTRNLRNEDPYLITTPAKFQAIPASQELLCEWCGHERQCLTCLRHEQLRLCAAVTKLLSTFPKVLALNTMRMVCWKSCLNSNSDSRISKGFRI